MTLPREAWACVQHGDAVEVLDLCECDESCSGIIVRRVYDGENFVEWRTNLTGAARELADALIADKVERDNQ